MDQSGSAARVLVVEADRGTRERYSSLLEQAGFVPVPVPSGEQALAIAREELPRLVILEIELPGISGYEVLRQLRDAYGDTISVFIVSGVRTESYDRAVGLMAGADDYLVKPFAPEEFVARVRSLIRRSAPTPEGIATILTSREVEVLRLLAGGFDQREIARDLFISSRTVGTHIEHILSKLGVKNRAQAVALAYQDDLIGPTLHSLAVGSADLSR